MNYLFIDDLKKFLVSEFEGFPADIDIAPEQCPDGMEGDLTVNCFRFAKFCKIAPNMVAEKVVNFLNGLDDVEKAEAVKAFVNVTLTPAALYRDTVGDMDRLLADGILSKDDELESLKKELEVELNKLRRNK